MKVVRLPKKRLEALALVTLVTLRNSPPAVA